MADGRQLSVLGVKTRELELAMTIHALIDLQDLPPGDEHLRAALATLTQADSLAGLASEVTCIVPEGAPMPPVDGIRWRWVAKPGVEAAQAALTRAGREGAHLLVLSAPVAAAADAAVALIAAFDADPLFGAAHARLSNDGGKTVLPIFAADATKNGHTARRALLDLPAHYILPEYVSRCFVLRDELLANVDSADDRPASVGHLLLAYLRQARRVGFRSVALNTVVAHLQDPRDIRAEVPAVSAARDEADSAFARSRFARRPDLAREQRLASLHEPRPKVLLDARNLGVPINGTSKAFFGLADALRDRGPAWTVTLVASEAAAESHDLAARYRTWTVRHELPEAETFAAAFRPSQPWELSELIELHRIAAVNVYLILDTIAWDIVYTAPKRLDATWRFTAQYADALLFISDFSRQRFLTRFPVHPDVRADVCHLSLDPADYADRDVSPTEAEGPFWFVVGNHYDHKHLRPTLALLARAFPTTRLAVLGSAAETDRIRGRASGRLAERDLQSLYASAELVIFPSLYEGFGLPIVNALAYGRTVVARDSALLREIAGAYIGPGRLVPFTTPDTLVERLSRLRHGLPVPEVPLGSGGTKTHGWDAAAATVEAVVADLLRPHGARRRERDRHEAVLLLDEWART